MSTHNQNTPNPRRLLLAAIAALAVAGTILTDGIISRARSTQDLAQWTNLQAVPTVAIAKVAYGDAVEGLSLPGTIQPYAKAMIYARVSGYLKSWQQDIGAHVAAGQTLASIDTPDLDQQLEQASADLAVAAANDRLATVTAKRYSALVADQWISRQTMDNVAGDAAEKKAAANSARANVRRLQALESFKTVVAPFDGVVTQRNTDVGALINAGSTAGQELFEISDLHRVRIYVQVPQAYSADIRPGVKVTFEMPQYPGQTFDATLVTTSNTVNATSRSVLVELQADNPDGKLLGGTYCQVTFEMPGDPNLVRVPATALMPVNSGAQIAVLGADNRVVFKPVQLGRDFGDSVEVTAGLAARDRVIDSPLETLQSGDLVKVAGAKFAISMPEVNGTPIVESSNGPATP